MIGLGSDLFTVHNDYLEVKDLTSFIAVSRFYPGNENIFVHGLTLAQDLRTDSGINLFAKGIQLTHQHIARLTRFQENNPDSIISFFIRKDKTLFNSFQKQIENEFLYLIHAKENKKSYQKIVSGMIQHIENALSEVFSSEKFLFLYYQLKVASEKNTAKQVKDIYRHAMNVALVSTGIFYRKCQIEEKPFSRDELKNILLLGLIHNLGAIVASEKLLREAPGKQYKEYIKYCSETPDMLEEADIPAEIINTLKTYLGYFQGHRDFISRNDDKSNHVNILLVADIFCHKQKGLFDAPKPIDKILDELNVKAIKSEYSTSIVQALTSALDLKEMFDFYIEMRNLMQLCPLGGIARPYPLMGFRSPVVFICKDFRTDCEHLEASIRAINLTKEQGDLKPGSYARCMLTSPKLLEFYKEHYKDIKESLPGKKEEK